MPEPTNVVTSKLIISRHDIAELERLYAELAQVQLDMSECIKTAQAQHGDDDITVVRAGKEVTVKQKALWLETFHLGAEADCAKELRALYPDVFAFKDREQRMVADIEAWEAKAFGFNRTQMTLPNIIRLVRGLVDLEMRDRNVKGK